MTQRIWTGKKPKFNLWWFIYWTFTGKGHPDHVAWYLAEDDER